MCFYFFTISLFYFLLGLLSQQDCLASGATDLGETKTPYLPFSRRPIVCENGEEVTFGEGQNPRCQIVRALKDGPIVYMQDRQGQLYSFEVSRAGAGDEPSVLRRTKIFRMPILGTFYNLFRPNTFQLSRAADGKLAPWAISYINYDGKKCRTISLFEMVKKAPVVIRNREPWLPPWQHYTHIGPLNFTGVDITACGQWVAVSGFYRGKKAFAYRPLNFDSAGYNFLAYYQLQGQSEVTWKPGFLMRKLLGRLTTPKQVIHLPAADWQIVELSEYHQPNILLVEQGRRLIIPLPCGSRRNYETFSIPEHKWLEQDGPHRDVYNLYPRSWPLRDDHTEDLQPKYRKVEVDGRRGVLRLSNQEPLVGIFFPYEATEYKECIRIYEVRRTLFDFLRNKTHYFDSQGKQIQMKFISLEQHRRYHISSCHTKE